MNQALKVATCNLTQESQYCHLGRGFERFAKAAQSAKKKLAPCMFLLQGQQGLLPQEQAWCGSGWQR
jgi:hypothetical protein